MSQDNVICIDLSDEESSVECTTGTETTKNEAVGNSLLLKPDDSEDESSIDCISTFRSKQNQRQNEALANSSPLKSDDSEDESYVDCISTFRSKQNQRQNEALAKSSPLKPEDSEDESFIEFTGATSGQENQRQNEERGGNSDDESSIECTGATVTKQGTRLVDSSLLQSDDSDSDCSLLDGGPIFSKVHRPAAAVSRVTTTRPQKPAALTKEQRDEQRRRQKEEREAAKQREKQERAEQRKALKLQKEAEKQAEKQAKKRRVEQAQQSSGKFAEKEIVVVMHTDLATAMESVVNGLKEKYTVHSANNVPVGSIQWIRKDYLLGGAQEALDSFEMGHDHGYELLDRLVIVFPDPKLFVPLLEREDMDDDFPALEAFLSSLPSKKKVVMMVNQIEAEIDRNWNAHRRVRQDKAPPTDVELKDAFVWLLVAFQVECIPYPSEEQILAALLKMTRALSEAPYQQQVTELECIKKIKSACDKDSDAYTKAQDCWIRQLQQVPMMGETKARHLAEYFPTARSLWEAYQDPGRSESEKRLLIAPLLHETRQHAKLSDTVYRLFTSANPNELL